MPQGQLLGDGAAHGAAYHPHFFQLQRLEQTGIIIGHLGGGIRSGRLVG
jgi:hypothetical protein